MDRLALRRAGARGRGDDPLEGLPPGEPGQPCEGGPVLLRAGGPARHALRRGRAPPRRGDQGPRIHCVEDIPRVLHGGRPPRGGGGALRPPRRRIRRPGQPADREAVPPRGGRRGVRLGRAPAHGSRGGRKPCDIRIRAGRVDARLRRGARGVHARSRRGAPGHVHGRHPGLPGGGRLPDAPALPRPGRLRERRVHGAPGLHWGRIRAPGLGGGLPRRPRAPGPRPQVRRTDFRGLLGMLREGLRNAP